MSLEDGASTLTDLTASIISDSLSELSDKETSLKNILVCVGGRKNNILLNGIKKNLKKKINIKLIDELNINGDFVESQAFGYLAIRSYKNLPLSFPNTTGCRTPSTGGVLIDN